MTIDSQISESAESVYDRIAALPMTPQTRADRFIRAIVRQDLFRPLYILHAAEIGEPRLCDRGAVAFTSIFLDLSVRECLERIGFWNGRGHAIVFVGVLPFDRFLAVALHELAHAIERAPAADHEFWSYTLEHAKNRDFLRYVAGYDYANPAAEPGDHPPWHKHEAPWIRIALHLFARAALLGFAPPAELVSLAGDKYGLSDARLYADALGNEPFEWLAAGRPLADLADTPAPKAFQELWDRDTAHWQPPLTPATAAT